MPGRRLIVVSEREHSYLDLDEVPEVKIGRAPDNDVVLKDDMVSRRHSLIERGPDGEWRVRDLKSFNGTYLNERRIRDEPFELWDALRVGRTKMFLVDRVGEAAAGPVEGPGSTRDDDFVTPVQAEATPPAGLDSSAFGAAAPAAAASGEATLDDVELGPTRTFAAGRVNVAEVLTDKEVRGVVDDLVRRERELVEREVSRRVRDESAPAVLPGVDRFTVRARRFGPADGGGDFYDVFFGPAGAEDLCLSAGSVSGVGVAACVAATAARHSLRGLLAASGEDPAAVVGTLREVLKETLHPGSALSLLWARVTIAGRVTIGALGGTGALHYVAATEAVEVLRAPGRRDEEAARPEPLELTLKSGDRLVLASDGAGALRQMGGSEPFGVERLQAALSEHAALPPKELSARLVERFEELASGAPDRDATVIVVAPK